MLKTSLTEFESKLMAMLLDGEDEVLSLLREQFMEATIQSNRQTGVGFFIKFDVPKRIPGVSSKVSSTKSDFCFGDVVASILGLRNGAGFLIWVNNGYLTQLEGYSYGESWPPKVKNYELSYLGGTRNIEKLRNEWINI